jgi:regulator of protease activity HflC (stomatin/prohibitin superfamily)
MDESSSIVGSLAIGLLVLVVLFFILCFRIVGVGQVGIITSFGHVTREVQSGVVIKAPWPFQQLSKFDIRTQKDQADAAAASQDLQDVNATVVTNYHIDPTKVGDLYRTVGTDYKVRIIDPAIQESVKAVTARYPIAELITKRADVKTAVTDSLRNRLGKNGIVVDDISLTNLSFSHAFTAAIEQKQVAQQQAEQAQFNLQKAQVDAQAQAVQQASLTPEILEKMAIERWNGVMPNSVGGNSIFGIPLTK